MKRKVFEEINLGGIKAKNRFVRSAAGSGVASKDGHVTEDVLDWYKEVAEGGAGIVITEMMTVWDDTNFPQEFLRIDDDTYIEGLKKVADVIHANNSKIIAQIGNYGSLLHWEPNKKPFGPSEVKDRISGITPKEMTREDIKFVVDKFIESSKRSKEAGFDGVQVHAAHGFLLYKFLNPYYNLRTDEYGGTKENRARIIVEILNGIKEACGEAFPVFLKINASDFSEDEGSFTFEHCKEASVILGEAGYDAIEISGGIAGGEVLPARGNKDEAYNRRFAENIAEEISSDIILVGGIRNLELAEDIIQESKIKAIGMTRALTYEPGLINRWKDGAVQESKCIMCNKCFTTEGQMCIFKRD